MKKRVLALTLALALVSAMLCSCAPSPLSAQTTITRDDAQQRQQDITDILLLLRDASPARDITEDFLQWCCASIQPDFAEVLLAALQTRPYTDTLLFTLFGSSLLVLYDSYTGAIDTDPHVRVMPSTQGPVTLAFTGDVNLADTWENMLVLAEQPGGIKDCISANLMQRMRQADILLVNNEFCYSSGGQPTPDKKYTFRAHPDNVEILQQMGTDIVSLANNHSFDYGAEAFEETLDTLDEAGIARIGAGRDVAEAMQAQYFIAGGMKIAYVAASRTESYFRTPAVSGSQAGVLSLTDAGHFLQAVRAARENADVVVAYPHWGTENTPYRDSTQKELAPQLVEAGVDLIVGSHPHCLQGIGYIKEVPVVYSLGNYWFNTDTVDTALLEVELRAPDDMTLRIHPCLQAGGKTRLLTEESERRRIFNRITSVSTNIAISPEGIVSPMQDAG